MLQLDARFKNPIPRYLNLLRSHLFIHIKIAYEENVSFLNTYYSLCPPLWVLFEFDTWFKKYYKEKWEEEDNGISVTHFYI